MGQRKPFLPHAEYVASVARFCDETGNVLIVKPWYRNSWLIPDIAALVLEDAELTGYRFTAPF